jgi:hypothetical protein
MAQSLASAALHKDDRLRDNSAAPIERDVRGRISVGIPGVNRDLYIRVVVDKHMCLRREARARGTWSDDDIDRFTQYVRVREADDLADLEDELAVVGGRVGSAGIKQIRAGTALAGKNRQNTAPTDVTVIVRVGPGGKPNIEELVSWNTKVATGKGFKLFLDLFGFGEFLLFIFHDYPPESFRAPAKACQKLIFSSALRRAGVSRGT